MRKRYAATFFLGNEGSSGPLLQEVSEVVIQWILHGGRTKLPPDAQLAPGEDMARTDLGAGAWLEAIAEESEGVQYWGIRFGHPDEDDERVEWHTEVSVTRLRDGRTAFSCLNLVGTIGGYMVPTRREASRPRIVVDVLGKWGGYRGRPLSPDATVLREDRVAEFVGMLRSPDRVRPVVLISAENSTDAPVIDADKVADYLAGVAHVYVAEDRFVSIWGLRDALPRGLACWDGAVRVYWPGLRLADDPFPHRVWRSGTVRAIHSDRRSGFREYLLGMVSDVAVFSEDPMTISWTALERLRRQRLITEAKAAGDQDELLELADQELIAYAETIEELRAQVKQLAGELQAKEASADSWRLAYEELRRTGAALEPNEEEEMVPLDSVADVLDRARREFEGKLVFALNGRSDGERSHFLNPRAVYAGLSFLAHTYYEARVGNARCDDFDAAMRAQVEGWSYDAHQSKNTMKKYETWYSTKWNGRKFYLPEHIGTGSGKNPQHTIRIAFNWDEATKRVVIGFLGQHQQTDAT